MDNINYNVRFNTDSGTHSIYDECVFQKLSSRNLTYSIFGTILLSTNPNIYAKEIKYDIIEKKGEAFQTYDQSYTVTINELINELNRIEKLNFSKNNIIKSILSFKSLKNSWDGYGALPLEIESATNAINIISNLDEKLVGKIDDLYPNSHGTITIEWVNDLNEKLHLEIGNFVYNFFVKLNNMDLIFFNDLKINNENIKFLSEHIKSI